MVRVISQETYDEVIKENIEDLEMSPEEAIKDAIAQFEAQGVDLSNIIKDLVLGSGDDHLVTITFNKLKKLSDDNEFDDDDLLLKELDVLKEECNKDLARRVRAGKDGVYPILISLLANSHEKYLKEKNKKDEKIIIALLNTLTALMDTQPDLLDQKGIDLIKSLLINVQNEKILIATLQWTGNCCVKHEMNRQRLYGKDLTQVFKKWLNSSQDLKIQIETLQVIRKLTFDDDVRVEFGKAHEHAKEMGVQLLEPLMLLLKGNTKPPLVSEIMLTMATLLVRHELCSMVAKCGVAPLFTVLADNYDDGTVIQHADKLITALAGNDDVKRELVKSGMVPVIVSLLTRHSNNPTTSALTLKCMAALTLREPDHSKQFLENGAPEAIVGCMKVHKDNGNVQKNACWAIRNMVARCREQNAKFHELGVEAILNRSYEKFNKSFGFDIKSALRDLECDVQLDEQWTGKGVQMDQ